MTTTSAPTEAELIAADALLGLMASQPQALHSQALTQVASLQSPQLQLPPPSAIYPVVHPEVWYSFLLQLQLERQRQRQRQCQRQHKAGRPRTACIECRGKHSLCDH